MKVIHIIKKLNNTELGQGNTHETYVYVPQDLDVDDLFGDTNMVRNFVDKQNHNNIYKIRYTANREKRIVGLGNYYRDKDICAGDEIILEKIISKNNKAKYFIDSNKKLNILILQRCKNGFEIITKNRNDLISEITQIYLSGEIKNFSIDFLEIIRKRSDSPNETEIYDVKVDGVSIVDNYQKKEMIEIEIDSVSKIATINTIQVWAKYIYYTEDDSYELLHIEN